MLPSFEKNGIIRIVVPDLKCFVEHYLNGEILAEYFIENLYVLYEEPGDTLLKKKLAPWFRYPHKCMYDTSSLIRIMVGNLLKVRFQILRTLS